MRMKKLAKNCKNNTWELNHAIIRDCYVKLIGNLKRKPTYDEVSKDINLSVNTIKKHIDTLQFDPQKHPLRILSDNVLMAIYDSAIKGNTGSQKLWMQLCEGWSEKQIMEHKGKVNTEVDFTGFTDKELEMLEMLGMKRFWGDTKQLTEHGIYNN